MSERDNDSDDHNSLPLGPKSLTGICSSSQREHSALDTGILGDNCTDVRVPFECLTLGPTSTAAETLGATAGGYHTTRPSAATTSRLDFLDTRDDCGATPQFSPTKGLENKVSLGRDAWNKYVSHSNMNNVDTANSYAHLGARSYSIIRCSSPFIHIPFFASIFKACRWIILTFLRQFVIV